MELSELITQYGDENIELQNLDSATETMDFNAKKGWTITFGTSMESDLKGTKKLGLVIWLDRDKVKEILGTSSPTQQSIKE